MSQWAKCLLVWLLVSSGPSTRSTTTSQTPALSVRHVLWCQMNTSTETYTLSLSVGSRRPGPVLPRLPQGRRDRGRKGSAGRRTEVPSSGRRSGWRRGRDVYGTQFRSSQNKVLHFVITRRLRLTPLVVVTSSTSTLSPREPQDLFVGLRPQRSTRGRSGRNLITVHPAQNKKEVFASGPDRFTTWCSDDRSIHRR